MSVIRWLLAVLTVVVGLHDAVAHGSRADHYNDVARILNGFGTADYNDAAKCHQRVLSNAFSPNAAQSTVESDKAFAGFYEVFDQVSSRMDSMPRELELKFGLPRSSLSHPKYHRFLCHGWALDKDPPDAVLTFFEKKSGVNRVKLLDFWHDYQSRTFELVEKYTRLSAGKAKAFAGLMWDIHLIGDWMPDNSEVHWLVSMKEISDDFIRNLEVLLGGEPKTICDDITKFVESRLSKNVLDRHIAPDFLEWLSEKRIGDRIYRANRAEMKGLWNADVAVNINGDRATLETKRKIAKIGAEKEAARLAKEAKRRGSILHYQENPNPKNLVREFKSQCKAAKVGKGAIPKSISQEGVVIRDGYLVRVAYKNSGRNAFLLFLKSPAFKSLKAGAAEGACAFVVSSGILMALHHNGVIDDDEFRHEMEKATLSSAVVGAAVGVTVALGASPTGWVVIAVGVGGYLVCDIAFELLYTKPFSVDDIIGFMDEDFEPTMSFMTIGTKSIDTFVDAKRGDGILDLPDIPTFVEPIPSKTKSFVDFLKEEE